MSTNTITRELLAKMRADMDAALAAVATKHGVALRVGNCTFDATTAKFALTVAAVGQGQQGLTPEEVKAAADWQRYATLEGLGKDWVGKTFTRRSTPGVEWTVMGFMPRRRAYPVLIKRNDTGKLLLITVDEICGHMGTANT